MSLNLPGKTLCCPPKVSSPKGRPRIINIDKIMTTPNEIHPIITNGSITIPPYEDTLFENRNMNKKLEVS